MFDQRIDKNRLQTSNGSPNRDRRKKPCWIPWYIGTGSYRSRYKMPVNAPTGFSLLTFSLKIISKSIDLEILIVPFVGTFTIKSAGVILLGETSVLVQTKFVLH